MRIAIIGAGVGGMSAAYDLVRAGHTVVLYEAEAAPGGLAGGFRAPGWEWSVEKFYHHWFQTDLDILGLIGELGWKDRLLFPKPVTAVYHAGRFYPYDTILAWLAFPGLPFFHRVWNLFIAGLFLRLNPFWKPFEGVTADAWMRRWFGERIYNKVWKPLLVGKFGEKNYSLVNMAWFWARFHTRTTRLGSFAGGMQAFLDALAGKLAEMGATLRFSVRIERLAADPLGGILVQAGGSEEKFDSCLVTVSPQQLAHMAPSLAPGYLAHLLALRHMGAVVMVLALRKPLSRDGVYWHNLPKESGFPFLALVEHTNFLPREHFGGDHLVYCGDYLPLDHEYFKLTKDQLLERFLPSFQCFNPDFDRSWVRETWLFSSKYAQPIPMIHHSRSLPGVRTPIRGLYFASMSQVYPWDRGMNFAVRLARQAARLMMDDWG